MSIRNDTYAIVKYAKCIPTKRTGRDNECAQQAVIAFYEHFTTIEMNDMN